MAKQLELFKPEQLTEQKAVKPKKKQKAVKLPPLLEGKIYQQMPPHPDHKDVVSIDPDNERGWTPLDWRLHMDKEHPHIDYTEE